MTLVLRFAARSHTGLLRPHNEDSVYAGPRLLAVADGVGGSAAGELASAVTIATIAPLDDDVPGADLLAALQGAAETANDHLRDLTSGDETLSGMGTTLVALLFSGTRVGLVHIGDSRCYLLRDGGLAQITHDHTLVQVLVDEGRISEEEARSHPQKSVVTRVIDGRPELALDLSVREARVGDRYLVCSDGLTGPVGSLDTLRDALALPEPQAAVDRLVQLALKGGGPDNVTVIVADLLDSDDGTTLPPVVAGAAAESPQEAPPGIADSPASRARVAEGRDIAPRERVRPAAAPGRHRRSLAVGLGLAVVVLAGAIAGFTYVRTQYYVGFDQNNVVVFRGVQGHLAGVSFHAVSLRSTLTRGDLSSVEADRVDDGIPATGKSDARAIVTRLVAEADCSTPAATPSPVPTATRTAGLSVTPTTPTSPTASLPPTPQPSQEPTPAASPSPDDCS